MNLIKNLPVRLPEIGRLRLGEKGDKGEPRRLDTFRFTSRDEVVVKAFAARYGGDVEPWEDGQWQVVSESTEIEILVPPDPLSSAYERWGSGGCTRRCDGETADVVQMSDDGGHLVPEPCVCLANDWTPGDRDDVKKGACTVAVRLSVIDPYAPGVGTYLLTTGSINAAIELPGQVALVRQMVDEHVPVPAWLAIEPRKVKKPWERFAREFVVPVLRARLSIAQMLNGNGRSLMREMVGAAPVAIAGPEPKAIEAGAAEPPPAPPAKPAAKKASAAKKTAGNGKPSPFPRGVATNAKRYGIEGDDLDGIVAQATDGALSSVDAITEPQQANKVIALLNRLGKGEVELRYRDDGSAWLAERAGATAGQYPEGEEPF